MLDKTSVENKPRSIQRETTHRQLHKNQADFTSMEAIFEGQNENFGLSIITRSKPIYIKRYMLKVAKGRKWYLEYT